MKILIDPKLCHVSATETCKRCTADRLIEDLAKHRSKGSRLGYRPYCKPCWTKEHGEWLKTYRGDKGKCLDCGGTPKAGKKICADCQAVNSHNRIQRRRKHKSDAVTLYGRKCNSCKKGDFPDAFFHFHHPYPELKSKQWNQTFEFPWDRVVEELKIQRVVLLCGYCHTLVHGDPSLSICGHPVA